MIRTVAFDNTTFARRPQRSRPARPTSPGDRPGRGDRLRAGRRPGAYPCPRAGAAEYGTRALTAIPGRTPGRHTRERRRASFPSWSTASTRTTSAPSSTPRVAIRAGHHCTMPLMTRFGIPGTARASLGLYNGLADLDALVAAIHKAQDLWDPPRHRGSHMSGMRDSLRELYQEVIFDHSNRNPRNYRPLPAASHHADGRNNRCAATSSRCLQLEDGIVREASFVGHGCAISTASASLMTEAVKANRSRRSRRCSATSMLAHRRPRGRRPGARLRQAGSALRRQGVPPRGSSAPRCLAHPAQRARRRARNRTHRIRPRGPDHGRPLRRNRFPRAAARDCAAVSVP